MKRRGLFIAVILISLLSVNLVSAQGAGEIADDVGNIIDDFVEFISPVASRVLGETPSGQYLFAKVLFLIIILAIVWTALSRIDFFNENTWVLWIVSIGASVLATRWLTTEGLINTIILPYSALGIAISAGLPFVLYFLVVSVGFKEQPAIVRRIAWIFFAVIFIGLWITRRSILVAGGSRAVYIYPVTVLLAIIMAVMDGTIHKFFVKLEVEKVGRSSARYAIDDLRKKLQELPHLVNSNVITQGEADKRKKEYKKKLAYLSK